MTEETATIIDTKTMIEKLDSNERFTKMKETKKLNKMASLEIEGEMTKKKNPFENMKIPRSALRKKGTRKKKPALDFSKFTVNEYTYDEFSKSVNSVLPNLINHGTFKDDEFLKKLKNSKDIKHFCNEQIMFPITNDYIGFAGAILGCGLEYYTEKKLGVKQEEPKKEEKKEDKKEHILILDNLDGTNQTFKII